MKSGLLGLLILTPNIVFIRSECPVGWVHNGVSCYLFSGAPLTWYDAHSSCAAHNSKLAEVHSLQVMLFLRSMSSQLGHDYWLGGRDDILEGRWQWASTGSLITVTDWAPGEPDDSGNTQDCLYIWSRAHYHWDDGDCIAKLRFICEIKYPIIEIVGR